MTALGISGHRKYERQGSYGVIHKKYDDGSQVNLQLQYARISGKKYGKLVSVGPEETTLPLVF